MKRTYKFFWIILIALIPLLPSSGWNFSIDVSDVGFNMNQYRFCFTDMDSTYLPLFLTNILGGCLLKVFGILHRWKLQVMTGKQPHGCWAYPGARFI